jgi:hypothetical protein
MRIDLEHNHWSSTSLDDVKIYMDPIKVNKPKTKEIVDGYEHSASKQIIKLYEPKLDSLYPKFIQDVFNGYHSLGGITLWDVPREDNTLILNGEGRTTHINVNMASQNIQLITFDRTLNFSLNDFPYMMEQGFSNRHGFIKINRIHHLGSGVYLNNYSFSPRCDEKMLIPKSISNSLNRSMQADYCSMHNSQTSVVSLSILSDTDRRNGILKGDITSLDQATNFCYAVTGSKDPNYNEVQLIDTLQAAAQSRQKQLVPYKFVPKCSKHLQYLKESWTQNSIFNRCDYLRKSKSTLYPIYVQYQIYSKGYSFISSIISSYGTYKVLNSLIGHLGSRFRKFACSFSISLLVGICTYSVLHLLKRALPSFHFVNPELSLYDKTKSIRKGLGCQVCCGKFLHCRYCDYLPRKIGSTTQIIKQTIICGDLPSLCYTIANFEFPHHHRVIEGISKHTPQLLATMQKNRFPVPMDNTLQLSDTCPSKLNNYSGYTLPGFHTPEQMVEYIRTCAVKDIPMKNQTSLLSVYEDLRMNCIQPDIKSALTALFCRQGSYDVQPQSGYLDSIGFNYINKDLIIEAATNTLLVNSKDFIKQSEPRKRQIYQHSIDKFHDDPRLDNTYTVFAKAFEMAYKTKRGRIICGPSSKSKGITAWVNHNLIKIHKQYWRLLLDKDPLFKNVPHSRKIIPFIHGMSTSDIRLSLQTCFRTFKKLRMITLDIKGFDGSQNVQLLALDVAYHILVFRILCARMGFNYHQTESLLSHATTLEATLKLYIRDATMHYKIKKQSQRVLAAVFKAHQSVFSGNPYLTTLGNTNRQLRIIYALIQKCGLQDSVYAFASGDDMCIALEDDVYDTLISALNGCYAKEGTTGQYGSGMILKEIMTSTTSVKFLSKKLEVFGSGIDCTVEFYRDIPRFILTGGSGKALPIEPAMVNYMNTSQLESQCYGDPSLISHIEYRKKTMPHSKPSRRAWKIYLDNSEQHIINGIHITHENRDLSKCLIRDQSYALLKSKAKTHEILLAAEGCSRL